MIGVEYTIVDEVTGNFIWAASGRIGFDKAPKKSCTSKDPVKMPGKLMQVEKWQKQIVTDNPQSGFWFDGSIWIANIKPKILKITYEIVTEEDKLMLAIIHGGEWKND